MNARYDAFQEMTAIECRTRVRTWDPEEEFTPVLTMATLIKPFNAVELPHLDDLEDPLDELFIRQIPNRLVANSAYYGGLMIPMEYSVNPKKDTTGYLRKGILLCTADPAGLETWYAQATQLKDSMVLGEFVPMALGEGPLLPYLQAAFCDIVLPDPHTKEAQSSEGEVNG